MQKIIIIIINELFHLRIGGPGGNRGGFDRGDRDGGREDRDGGRGPPGGLFCFVFGN